ncbi:unnamed protein product [Polarella glacialis]|uniref:Uncharacterized protein n=1 Tax=Polarella glacialis TaxID=89957 RepID=A0A813III8_POLGL|nr:unnamed protein product [Polarella glacialis]
MANIWTPQFALSPADSSAATSSGPPEAKPPAAKERKTQHIASVPAVTDNSAAEQPVLEEDGQLSEQQQDTNSNRGSFTSSSRASQYTLQLLQARANEATALAVAATAQKELLQAQSDFESMSRSDSARTPVSQSHSRPPSQRSAFPSPFRPEQLSAASVLGTIIGGDDEVFLSSDGMWGPFHVLQPPQTLPMPPPAQSTSISFTSSGILPTAAVEEHFIGDELPCARSSDGSLRSTRSVRELSHILEERVAQNHLIQQQQQAIIASRAKVTALQQQVNAPQQHAHERLDALQNNLLQAQNELLRREDEIERNRAAIAEQVRAETDRQRAQAIQLEYDQHEALQMRAQHERAIAELNRQYAAASSSLADQREQLQQRAREVQATAATSIYNVRMSAEVDANSLIQAATAALDEKIRLQAEHFQMQFAI